MKRNILITFSFLMILSFFFFNIKKEDRLELALNFAGNNRQELEIVLENYKDYPLKYKAARFLIENMPYHYSVDKDYSKRLQPVYDKHEIISLKYNWTSSLAWGKEIDSLEIASRGLFKPISDLLKNSDSHTIKSDWLIEQIDLAFKAWKDNKYTQNISFEDFCQYILPYRFSDKFELDNSRERFYRKYKDLFDGKYGSFINATDSLLYLLKDIRFNSSKGNSIPIFNAKTLEQIRYSRCEERCWYNSLVLSSTGMAVAIDGVPCWASRNNSHTWNALLINGQTYPFEPFWDNDRWKYSEIYNNIAIDSLWGKVRLPKVFRKTFAIQLNGPLADKDVTREDIPIYFRNPFLQDVSNQYFDTTDVEIALSTSLKKIPKYAYICAYNYRQWVPVQWGKVNNRSVSFKGMGRDIVYLICFYKNGNLTPVSSPFYLSQTGSIRFLQISDKKQNIVTRTIGYFVNIKERNWALKPMDGAIITSVDSTKIHISDTLLTINMKMDISPNVMHFKNTKKMRYINIELPTDTIALCDLSFYEKRQDVLHKIPNVEIKTEMIPLLNNGEIPSMIHDSFSGTGFYGRCKNANSKRILLDFGEERSISAISYIPYTKSTILKGNTYRLYLWNNGWQFVEEKEGNDRDIKFENVQSGTIYRIENDQSRSLRNVERIFTYQDGLIYWM